MAGRQPSSFQARLGSVMEVMTRALVRQVCEMVDGDLACLRLELARALSDRAAMSAKLRRLESEVGGLRGPAQYRSVCVQTREVLDAPAINGIFGKEWCSSLWDGRDPRAEEKVTEVEPAVPDESYHEDSSEALGIKEEISEKEICPSDTTADASAVPARRKNLSCPSEPNDFLEVNLIDDDSDNNAGDDDNIYFMSAGFFEDPDVQPLPSGFPRADVTKIISADGTIKHVMVPSDDRPEFNEHCIPMEFTEGENPNAHLLQQQEVDSAQDLLIDSENASSLGSGENLNYFNRFNLHEKPERDKGSTRPKFRCSECSKMFLRQSSLTVHKKCHQRQNSHRCHSCKVAFPQMNLLRTHKCLPPDSPSKTLNQRFGCEHCGKRFHSRANLRVHYAVHTGERPHRCSYCGRGFTQKGNLNTHERIHRGEKPFVCPICGKRFTQKVNLNHHVGIHSGIRKSRAPKAAEKPQ